MASTAPQLKNGVDLQVQVAYREGNWPVVIRLSEKRARLSNDVYYEVLKAAAQTQLDTPSDKFAAIDALHKFVHNGTIIKDADALDLLEWACLDLLEEADYSGSAGILRTRLAKAMPKDESACERCLTTCLLHWDLTNAQQIAAIMDRSFPQKGNYMFYNIAITHLLALSNQCSGDKSKLYGKLALKQMQRAAQLAKGNADSGNKVDPRSVQSEEEILLLYEVTHHHGTEEDVKGLIRDPHLGPLKQFELGRKELLMRFLRLLREKQECIEIYALCKGCLSRTDKDGNVDLLASDWEVWKQFIEAAQAIGDVQPDAAKSVHDLIRLHLESPTTPPIYKRNLQLSQVHSTFTLVPAEPSTFAGGSPSPGIQLRQLMAYFSVQKSNIACFEDVRDFFEKLSLPEMRFIAYQHIPDLGKGAASNLDAICIAVLACKLQYLVTTCPQSTKTGALQNSGRQCVLCESRLRSDSCHKCLEALERKAATLYESTRKTGDGGAGSLKIDPDLQSDLVLLVCMCLIRRSTRGNRPPRLLQAALMLEQQLTRTSKDSRILLFLDRIYMLIGCPSRSNQHWQSLEVKRTTMDPLGPLHFDRISTIAPHLCSASETQGRHSLDGLRNHFAATLKTSMPAKLVNAFYAGSYSSVLNIPRYIESLRWSCSRAMSLVEEGRGGRAVGGKKLGSILSDPRFLELTDGRELKPKYDVGSFPRWQSHAAVPIHQLLSLGPPPSGTRSSLALLSEAYFDVLSFKPPPSYKPPALPATGPEHSFVVESLDQLDDSMSRLLVSAGPWTTQAERLCFRVLQISCSIVTTASAISRAEMNDSDPLRLPVSAVASALASMRQFSISLSQDCTLTKAVQILASLHQLSHLRDAASGVGLAVNYLRGYNEKERERDGSGKTTLPKEVVQHLKSLEVAAAESLKDAKELIAFAKKEMIRKDAAERLQQLIVSDAEDVIEASMEAIGVEPKVMLLRVAKGWNDCLDGWGSVKWE